MRGLASVARTQGIPPGQELLVERMLDAPRLEGGCRLEGAAIGHGSIVATYRCASGRCRVELAPRNGDSAADLRTRQFALRCLEGAECPSGLLRGIEPTIVAHEAAWMWGERPIHVEAATRPGPEDLRNTRPWPPAVIPILLAVGVLWVIGLGWRRRGRAVGVDWRSAGSVGILAVLACATVSVAALGAFEFAYDDYRFLFQAMEGAAAWEEGRRLISGAAIYRLADHLDPGAHWPFQLANGLALAATVWAWASILAGSGYRASEASLAAAMFGMAPGVSELLVRASGIENLLGSACLLWAVRVAQRAVVSKRWPDVALLLAIVATGVFVKYVLMLMVPPMVLLFARPRGEDADERRYAFASAAAAAAIVVAIWRLTPGPTDPWLHRIPTASEIRHAAELAGQDLSRWLPRLALAMALAVGGCGWAWWRRRVVDPPVAPQPPSAGNLPPWRVMVVAFVVMLAPFTLNHGNYQAYYAWLASAPVAAVAATVLVRLAGLGRTGLVTTCCVIATLIPWGSVVPESDVVKARRAREFLGLLADTLPPHRTFTTLELHVRCGRAEETTAARQRLDTLLGWAHNVEGIRWATRRPTLGLRVVQGAVPAEEPDVVRLRYCEGIEVPRAGAD